VCHHWEEEKEGQKGVDPIKKKEFVDVKLITEGRKREKGRVGFLCVEKEKGKKKKERGVFRQSCNSETGSISNSIKR